MRTTFLKSPTTFWTVSQTLRRPSYFGTLQNQHWRMHPRVRNPYAVSSPGSYHGLMASAYGGMRLDGLHDPIPP